VGRVSATSGQQSEVRETRMHLLQLQKRYLDVIRREATWERWHGRLYGSRSEAAVQVQVDAQHTASKTRPSIAASTVPIRPSPSITRRSCRAAAALPTAPSTRSPTAIDPQTAPPPTPAPRRQLMRHEQGIAASETCDVVGKHTVKAT
jgi:hypothetical protein